MLSLCQGVSGRLMILDLLLPASYMFDSCIEDMVDKLDALVADAINLAMLPTAANVELCDFAI